MPAVEIADSIVQSGRETLEKVRDLNYIYISYVLTVFRLSTLSTAIGNGEQRYIRAILESRLPNLTVTKKGCLWRYRQCICVSRLPFLTSIKMLNKYRYLLGKTKEQAFAIGNEIAAAITAQNPAPIKLKFEKVI